MMGSEDVLCLSTKLSTYNSFAKLNDDSVRKFFKQCVLVMECEWKMQMDLR